MNSEYLQKVLLTLGNSENDVWRVEDALKGISIMGGTGSGKTSASGKALANKFLQEGWGGLVLCAKTDEVDLWREYCRKAGRLKDLIVFEKGAKDGDDEEYVFNPVEFEMTREGEGAGETQNITNIFMNIYRMGNRIAGEGDTQEERYWDTALKRCLNRIIELIKLSGEDLSYKNMVRVLSTAGEHTSANFTDKIVQIESGQMPIESIRNSFCTYCLMKAYNNTRRPETTDVELNSYDLVEDYFLNSLPNMGSKTKSVVVESFMGLAEPFLSGLLYRHFSGTSNIFPEWTYTHQKIIILNFPIKEYLDTGIIAQCVFKLMFQQCIERRDTKQYPTPVFLWADEAQYFVNPYDQIFLTTARSSRTSTVFLSQNISNYFAVMGSGGDAKARVDSLMGNLSTKIFHANTDAETNEYASRLIGNVIKTLGSAGLTKNPVLDIDASRQQGLSSQYLPQIEPREFTTLLSGGDLSNFKVQAVINVSGRKWSQDKNYIKATFTQDFKC